MKNLSHYFALFGVAVLSGTYLSPLLAQTSEPASQGGDFHILRHEPLNNMYFTEQQAAASGSATASQSANTTLSIQAFGKQFMLELQPNDRLFENLPLAQKHRLKQSMQLYKGRIAGIKGSWVRLNRVGGRISGAFWDGNELYMIDSANEIGKALAGSVATKSAVQNAPVIYRLSDTQSNTSCAVAPKAGALNNFRALVGELQAQAKVATATQATRKLDVAIVTDVEFNQANANPQAVVAARMNVVDGIFSEQVGVHINVSQISPLASDGPLTATDPETLLDQFANYMQSSGANNPGLAHLFTARDMDSNVVGIAYIGALCDKHYGVGASQVDANGTYGALTVAHEMGHNFGSPHDNQSNSACAATADTFLMNPVLNGSSQFSPCSLQQMAPEVSAASCLVKVEGTLKADVRPVFPVNPIATVKSGRFVYRVEVKNAGTSGAIKTTANITVPTALTINSALASVGRCTRTVGKVACSLGTLAAGATRTVTLTLKAGTKAAKLVSTVQVGADNDSNTTNNTGKVVINVR